jgi:hypothetical protein
MDKLKPALTLIGIGIVVGVVIALALILVFGAKLSRVNVGPIEFEIPTATPPVHQSTAAIQQLKQQPTAIGESSTQSPQVSPTSAPTQPTAESEPFVTTFEVFANLSWQDTGVQVMAGDSLRIIWDGKSRWRGTNTGDFSDPLGGYIDPNPNHTCPPLMPSDEAGWNALISKIGEAGVPTNPFKMIPTGEGNLYLAMNDCDAERHDNEGSIVVTIEVRH